ncbi:hypothetical protein A6A08_11735 [Nocardiopsis sp. TSRI0078]|nr:hypothetical protein A6A08_11735 [Nocardiopsis sp. TSRI0078]
MGDDVRTVRNLFTGFGYAPVLEGIGDYGSANDIREKVRRWMADVEPGEEDVVVLYFAGHGHAPDRDRHHLCCWDTREETPAATAPATEDLVRILCEGRLRRLLLVLDTCAAWSPGCRLPEAGRGVRPPMVRVWTNVADRRDVVALAKELAPLFGDVVDLPVGNGPRAHDASPYLTSEEVGRAVAAALAY